MNLKARVQRLERILLPLPSVQPNLQPLRAMLRRLVALLAEACLLLTEEEASRVDDAVRHWLENNQGALASWFRLLAAGQSRLPALPAEATKALLLAWLSADVDEHVCVCRRCGLAYPHRQPPEQWRLLPGKVPCQGPPPWYALPSFFAQCPGCSAGAWDMTWAHLVEGQQPWMNLDGHVARQAESAAA